MKSSGNVVFVTGGASGLGEAVVRGFAAQENKVVIFDMDEARGTALAQELGEETALFCKGDVTSEADMQEAVSRSVEVFGRITVLTVCAGIGSGMKVVGRKGPHSLDAFKKVVDIDLVGTFNAIRLVANEMQHNEPNEEGERGVIVCTSSIAAVEGQIGQSAYSAAKGGVNGLILTCAREFAPLGIRINAVSPGIIATPILLTLTEEMRQKLAEGIPFPARLGKPEEFFHLVRSIVENPFINGTNIRMDGAMRMPPK